MTEKKIARHRSFTRKARAAVEPPTFDIYDQTFTGRPEIQGAVVLEFLETADGADGASSAKKILSFFESALEPESNERFQVLIHDPETVVDLEELTEILAWLIEEYTSRPTQAS